jgi:galactokinase
VHDAFRARFGRFPDVVESAPGRVNLIGEHTDYNGGAVLPTAIPQRTAVAAGRRDDRCMIVHTTLGDARASFALGAEARRGGWLDYVQGCTWALAESGFRLGGCDLAIASRVPAGSGLSSSAALLVACLRALRALERLPLDDVAVAHLAHRAETAFVGARVGIMDQMAASLADEVTALHLDTHTLVHRRLPLSRRAELMVVDSGIRHAVATGDYASRRAECERAATLLGVERLCALGIDALDRIARLPAPLDRRARHVVIEHARVGEAVRALEVDDVERLGQLFLASHASQRDDYAVSTPEIDCLVDLAWTEPAVYGARLTGGGFGGSIVALVEREQGAAVAERVAAGYRRAMGRSATVLLPVTS